MAAAETDQDHAQSLYREAGGFLAKAYKVDGADYRTLFAYARTRTVEADYPTDNTLTVLSEAHGLAPQVSAITLETARALITRGRDADAATLLKPLAAQPHGGDEAKAAKSMLDAIAARAKPPGGENR
jgi:thioredoxin-like negative regulator of GroEL